MRCRLAAIVGISVSVGGWLITLQLQLGCKLEHVSLCRVCHGLSALFVDADAIMSVACAEYLLLFRVLFWAWSILSSAQAQLLLLRYPVPHASSLLDWASTGTPTCDMQLSLQLHCSATV